jgi:hypothetical protein
MVDGDFKNSDDKSRKYHLVIFFDFAGSQRAAPTSMLSFNYCQSYVLKIISNASLVFHVISQDYRPY